MLSRQSFRDFAAAMRDATIPAVSRDAPCTASPVRQPSRDATTEAETGTMGPGPPVRPVLTRPDDPNHRSGTMSRLEGVSIVRGFQLSNTDIDAICALFRDRRVVSQAQPDENGDEAQELLSETIDHIGMATSNGGWTQDALLVGLVIPVGDATDELATEWVPNSESIQWLQASSEAAFAAWLTRANGVKPTHGITEAEAEAVKLIVEWVRSAPREFGFYSVNTVDF